MMNDFLIEQLVADLKPITPLENKRWWRLCSWVLVVAAILVLLVLKPRPDMGQAVQSLAIFWKPGLFLSVALVGALLVTDYSRPLKRLDYWPWIFASIPAFTFGWQVLVQTKAQSGMVMLRGLYDVSAVVCLAVVGAGGAVALWALWKYWLRHTASSQPAMLGAGAGLCGGSLVAAAYALHCDHDSVLYLLSYYMSPIVLLTCAGSFLAKRKLHW